MLFHKCALFGILSCWAGAWSCAAERIVLQFDAANSLAVEGGHSSQDLQRYRKQIHEWCAHGMAIGYLANGCIAKATDFVSTFAHETVEPCHAEAVLACSAPLAGQPASEITPPLFNAAVDLSGLSPSNAAATRIRRRQLISGRALSSASLCTANAFLQCSVHATLIVDLNCDDYGPQLSVLFPDYKYICVSGAQDSAAAANASFFSTARRELIRMDIFSPNLFQHIRETSRLWAAADVTVIVARQLMEFVPYSASLAFLERVKHSGADFLMSSTSAGLIAHNPVQLDTATDFTPLNLHRYPFQLTEPPIKWSESHIAGSEVTAVYSVLDHIPSGYPYYYDDLVCGPEAAAQSRQMMSASCRERATASTQWALFVHRAEGSVHSQDGQDGALQYIFDHIGVESKSFVEFGFNGPTYARDSGANSNFLYQQGWRGLLLDGDNDNPEINLHKTWVDPATIVDVFDKHKVPMEVDYLSIDIDSTELWTFRAIVSSGKYRPRVVSVEYNSNHPLESTLCNVGNGYRWNVDRVWGSALLPLKMIGDEFGYALVDVVPYLDAIFVRNDLLNGSSVPEFESWRRFTSLPHHRAGQRSQDEIRKYIVDYAEWTKNGHNIELAQGDIVFEQIRRLGISL